ncbi:MAG: hypothetical protein A3H79_03990 [Candidatus Levybacteria bacterium RIFCSPLOWO2_02_FULL_36_8b]|nr:MAG: hypothetical protein A3H79_03990 [Candidatus Levybacteria bacterium RIFCSPLOWO2_02_FULL_36_8b]
MNQTVTVPVKTINDIFSRLDELTKTVKKISARLFEKEPSYGSDEWWEWSDKEALREIKAGKGIKIHNKKELNAFFNNLKTA